MLFILKLVIILTWLTLSCGSERILIVPSIFQDQSVWFSIRSKQVDHISGAQSKDDTNWLVEDHFSFDEGISYSRRAAEQRNSSDNELILLAFGSRSYRISSDPIGQNYSCQVNKKRDHLTRFPWRFVGASQLGERRLPEATIIGLGAVWLNAIQRDARCSVDEQVDGAKLRCSLDGQSGATSLRIDFVWPPDEEEAASLESGAIIQQHAIYGDETHLLRDISTKFEVLSIEQFAGRSEFGLREHIVELKDICESLHHQAQLDHGEKFPSLMHHLVESLKREYHFSLKVKVHSQSDSGIADNQPALANEYLLDDWFSYEQAKQTTTLKEPNNQLADQFSRLFEFKTFDSDEVCFWLKLDHQEAIECKLVDHLGEQRSTILPINSSLMQRTLEFCHKSEAETNMCLSEDLYSGRLHGIGALLMNVAELDAKTFSLLSDGEEFSVTKSNKWLSNVEWLVDDYKSMTRIRFHFRKRIQVEHNIDCDIDDLLKIEVFKLAAGKGEEGELVQLALEMSIEVLDFSTYLREDEFEGAFSLPDICLTDVKLEIKHDKNDADEALDSKSIPSFPPFEIYLNLARDYKISSRWSFDNGTELQVTEYVMSNGDMPNLYSRFDVQGIGETGSEFNLKYLLRHSSRTGILISGGVCQQVANLTGWLEKLSWSNQQVDNESMPLYGVGALWQLAGQSEALEFLGSFQVFNQSRMALWRLHEDENWKDDLSLTFNFKILSSKRKDLRSKLEPNSIEISANNRNQLQPFKKIRITQIKVMREGAKELDFVLPQSHNCGAKLEESFYSHPRPKFPTFLEALGANWRSLSSFELQYNLTISSPRDNEHEYLMRQMFTVSETHQIARNEGKLSLTSWKDNGQARNSLFLLTSANQTLLQENQVGGDVQTNRCKRTNPLLQFFGVGQYLGDILRESDEQISTMTSNLLLANIWHKFSEWLQIAQQTNNTSRAGQVRANYLLSGGQHIRLFEWTFEGNSTRALFTFEQVLQGKNKDRLKLRSLSLGPLHEQAHYKSSGRLDFVLGQVNLFEGNDSEEQDDFRFIDCIKHLETDSRASGSFPKLSRQLKSSDTGLHLRSQVTIINLTNATAQAQAGGGSQEIRMRDEWFQMDRVYRSKIWTLSELEAKFDYLINAETKEFFDLSKKNYCSDKSLWSKIGAKIAPAQEESERKLNWLVDNLIGLFEEVESEQGLALYGPIALWWLAELPEVELIRSDSRAIDWQSLLDDFKLNEWFKIEHWQVKYPQLDDELFLTFDFSNRKRPAELRQVEVGSGIAGNRRLLIEVVNYEFTSSALKFSNEFLIPKGFGCKRNWIAKRRFTPEKDAIFFEPSLSPVSFEYRASLRLVNEIGQLATKPVLHSGWFGRCPTRWKGMRTDSLRIVRERRHYFNGSLENFKYISTNESPGYARQVRTISRGHCSIERQIEANDAVLSLDFNSHGQEEKPIVIWETMLGKLGSDQPGFEMIQSIEDTQTNTTQLVYEARRPFYALNSDLVGPTSIVHTFERAPGDELDQGERFNHRKVKIEAIMFGKAHLVLQLNALQFEECLEILQQAQAEDCGESLSYSSNDGAAPRLRIFSLTLIDQSSFDGYLNSRLTDSEIATIEGAFVHLLLSLPIKLKPMQIGQVMARRESNMEGEIVIEFKLIEPPPSIEYFERVPKTSLDNSIGLAKFLASNYDCSTWCDSMPDCVAFSHCAQDRLCRTVTRELIEQETARPLMGLNMTIEQFFAGRLISGQNCSFFYAPSGILREPLEQTVQQLDEEFVGQGKFNLQIDNFAHSGQGRNYSGVQFSELQSNVVGHPMQEGERKQAFVLLHSASSSAIDHLARYEKEANIELKHLPSQAECMATCSTETNCQIGLYCGNTQLCTLISDLNSNWTTFRSLLAQNSISETIDHEKDHEKTKPNCSMFVRNFMLDYYKFSDTLEPSERIDEERNLSLIECAAKCELVSVGKQLANCLSFDYCFSSQTSKCYLQSSHVLMDQFDGSKLRLRAPEKKHYQKGEHPLECSHYSRLLLTTFEQSPKSSLVKHSQQNVLLKGVEAEKCALICLESETCLEFEYCNWQTRESLTSSCYIQSGHLDPAHDNQVQASERCSIYRLKYSEFNRASDTKREVQIWLSPLIELIIMLTYTLSALACGSILHIMYIISTGYRLPAF